jgi:excisionase family DNA binding protein
MEISSTLTATPAIRPLMDRKEAAEYLRQSVRTITNLVASRRLRPARIGRRLIFKRTEVDRYVDLLTAQSG